jgi:hypothetical protein
MAKANGNDPDFQEDKIPNYNLGNIKDSIREALKKIYAEECEIAALREQHLKPHTDERTRLWRELKADTTIAREDLKHVYGLLKRIWEADDAEEVDADLVRENIRTAFAAMAEDGTLDFISALGLEPEEPAPAEA